MTFTPQELQDMEGAPTALSSPASLTSAQRVFLVRARDATLGDGTGKGAYIWGRHEMRTANTLERDGLVRISVLSYARITDAGREAIAKATDPDRLNKMGRG